MNHIIILSFDVVQYNAPVTFWVTFTRKKEGKIRAACRQDDVRSISKSFSVGTLPSSVEKEKEKKKQKIDFALLC